jgi:hypothetical protein
MSPDLGRPPVRIFTEQPWFAALSLQQRALISLVAGAFIFLSGGVLDWFVTHQYAPRVSLVLAGAAVALAVSLLVFQVLTDIRERYLAMVKQLERVVELNHHIRNALQVIAYYNVPERGDRAIQQVNAEIVRIESVLRDVSAALGQGSSARHD